MFLGRLTLSYEVTICSLNVSRCGQQPSRGLLHVSFSSAPTTSPQNRGVVKLYVNAGFFWTMARWVASPTRGHPPSCKQSLRIIGFLCKPSLTLITTVCSYSGSTLISQRMSPIRLVTASGAKEPFLPAKPPFFRLMPLLAYPCNPLAIPLYQISEQVVISRILVFLANNDSLFFCRNSLRMSQK